jgi:hypothetical protein
LTILICGNLCGRCTRRGHTAEAIAIPENRGEPGHCQTVLSRHKNAIDGDVSTYMSASTYAARRAAERAQHFQSLQAIADLVQGDRRQGIPPDLSLQDTIVFHVGDDSDGDPAAVDFVTDGTPVRLPRRSGPSGNQVT